MLNLTILKRSHNPNLESAQSVKTSSQDINLSLSKANLSWGFPDLCRLLQEASCCQNLIVLVVIFKGSTVQPVHIPALPSSLQVFCSEDSQLNSEVKLHGGLSNLKVLQVRLPETCWAEDSESVSLSDPLNINSSLTQAVADSGAILKTFP